MQTSAVLLAVMGALALAASADAHGAAGHAALRRGGAISSRRSYPAAIETEQGHVRLDANKNLLRLRGGVEYYEDRMDVDAAIKALKQVMTS
jgi:hypothetical protein